jgi:hypothetical protein
MQGGCQLEYAATPLIYKAFLFAKQDGNPVFQKSGRWASGFPEWRAIANPPRIDAKKPAFRRLFGG